MPAPTTPYRPDPIDTSRVTLPRTLDTLIDLLAENSHKVWVKRRLDDGWTYGPRRDDTKKTSPWLVPYETLTEREREHNRSIATETLRVVMAFNYKVAPPEELAAGMSGAEPLTADETLATIRNSETDLESLSQLWNSRSRHKWAICVELFTALTSRLLEEGHPLMAYDVARQGLEYHADESRLILLLAVVRSRLGEHRQALNLARKVVVGRPHDAEAIGQLASAHKVAWRNQSKDRRRLVHLRQAIKFYIRAFESSQDYWPAINAATLLAIDGERERAHEWATRTLGLCQEHERRGPSQDEAFWLYATMAEAHAVLGDWRAAIELYQKAFGSGRVGTGRLVSTRRQAMLLAEHTGGPTDRLLKVMPAPRVVVFSGHMIDAPGRPEPRFPEGLARAVKREIVARLSGESSVIGVSAGASGADLLFIEALLDDLPGVAEPYLVLPFDREEFRALSVAPAGEAWAARFDSVCDRLEKSSRLRVLSPQKMGNGLTSLEYAMQVMLGTAQQLADQFDTQVTPLAVWDGCPGGRGGTGATVDFWRDQGLKVEVIDTKRMAEQHLPAMPRTDSCPWVDPELAVAPENPAERTMAMMFADVKGFSKLKEYQVAIFSEEYMGLAAETLKECGVRLEHVNTWGDAIYYVCESVRDAGVAALELTARLHREDWVSRRLPNSLGIRCALHAGPVVRVHDPVTGNTNFVGAHVSRAARIEPITPVGEVYASQAFAALSRLHGVRDYSCHYMGMVPMAKGYGVLPAYRVQSNDD